MKKILAASLLFLGGCATIVPPRVPVDPFGHLRKDIDAVLSDSLLTPTHTGIKIVSLNTGRILYERDSKFLMHPASNLKLITATTALKVLGNDYRFETTVSADSGQTDSVLSGNLYLKGYGDPDLTVADLDSMASMIHEKGIRRVDGDIVADVTYFDDLYWGSGWMWDDEPEPDEMFISPLSVNKNFVEVNVAPALKPGNAVIAAVDPPTPYVTITSNARTVPDTASQPLHVSRRFKERLNTITLDGEISVNAPLVRRRISVWQPELFAAELFKESLQRAGVLVLGQPRIGTTPMNAPELAQHGRRLDSVVIAMNRASDNLSAENLLKTMGARQRGLPGTARNGIYVENEFLSSLGIDTTALYLVDGSGVSHYNLLTADQIVQLLVGITRDPGIARVLYASLPIAGVNGTLVSRMTGTPAQGNLRAKTGTIGGVSTLSGYVRTSDGEMLAFAMIMENFIIPSKLVRNAQDRIGEILARFSRKRVAETSR